MTAATLPRQIGVTSPALRQTRIVEIDGVEIVVTAKSVRHLRLVVRPDGQVRASVPLRASQRTVDAFLSERIGWVQTQRARMLATQPASLSDGSIVRLWGDDIVLRAAPGRGGGRLTADGFRVLVADPTDANALAAAVTSLYRRETRAVLPDVVAKWAAELGHSPSSVTIRAMRTRWGSCTPSTGAIRINPELAARHPRCLSYVVLHEITHLTEPGHGPGFCAAMDAHLPNWRDIRAELNGRRR